MLTLCEESAMVAQQPEQSFYDSLVSICRKGSMVNGTNFRGNLKRGQPLAALGGENQFLEFFEIFHHPVGLNFRFFQILPRGDSGQNKRGGHTGI